MSQRHALLKQVNATQLFLDMYAAGTQTKADLKEATMVLDRAIRACQRPGYGLRSQSNGLYNRLCLIVYG